MIQLRPYQEEGLQALWAYFMQHKGNPVLAWPGGTGKSLVPAEFIRRTMVHYPNERFLMITHVKELIRQNHKKMLEIWPDAPIGIFSAGLKQKDILNPIVYGGIQSMVKIPHAFGYRSIAFIDEAHLVSPDDTSMYQRFLGQLKIINPRLKIIGMSATPWRIGQGMITEGGLFTDIVHDLTSMENFNKLIDEGYMSPLIPKKTQVELDVSNVNIQKGEFVASQLQHEVDKAEITWKALQELVYYGQNRKSWLIYATGIDHANHIASMLNQLGIECASVHSKQTEEYNFSALKAHKSLKLRSVVSYSKLTTGLDHPRTDLIGMFRPTLSTALWGQMLYRGTRPWIEGDYLDCYGEMVFIEGGKKNCLVLDFAKNTPRLGPINMPVIPNKKGNKTGDLPIKICDACGVYNHISARKCDACGTPFEFQVKIVERAGTEELIKTPEALVIDYFDVNHVVYKKHQKTDKPEYICATYFSGMNSFKEYVFPQSKNRSFFANWWRIRSAREVPATAHEAIAFTSELRRPKRIRVHVNRIINGKNWPEILGVEM